MTASNITRWQYRFDNFQRAFILLREAIEAGNERPLTQLEKEGTIQRFEYTIELAWKTMRDYLESQNLVFSEVTPRVIVREAFSAGLIADAEAWMGALEARNQMSHTYDFTQFEKVIGEIRKNYLAVIETLYLSLLGKIVGPNL